MKHARRYFIFLVILTLFGCASQPSQEDMKVPPEEPEMAVETQDRHWVPTQNGCLVYSPNPIPNETVTWSGACGGGKASGLGELTWYLDGEATGVYTGEFLEGEPQGRGVYKHLVPPIPIEYLPIFTLEDLEKHTGQDGAPAYVVYNGKVYDVSHSFSWANGEHQMSHWAGEESTASYKRAPHGLENMLEPFPVVGIFIYD